MTVGSCGSAARDGRPELAALLRFGDRVRERERSRREEAPCLYFGLHDHDHRECNKRTRKGNCKRNGNAWDFLSL